ncbi:hypothetical protein Hanom_Chr05g00456961 [Helianthus anomalus]
MPLLVSSSIFADPPYPLFPFGSSSTSSSSSYLASSSKSRVSATNSSSSSSSYIGSMCSTLSLGY